MQQVLTKKMFRECRVASYHILAQCHSSVVSRAACAGTNWHQLHFSSTFLPLRLLRPPPQSFQLILPSRIVHSHPLNRTLPVNWGAAWEERGWIPHKEGSSRAMILAKVNRHIKVYETHHPDFLASLLNHINYLNLLGCGPTLVSGGLFLTYLN